MSKNEPTVNVSYQSRDTAVLEMNCLPLWVIETTYINELNKTKQRNPCYTYIPANNTSKLKAADEIYLKQQ